MVLGIRRKSTSLVLQYRNRIVWFYFDTESYKGRFVNAFNMYVNTVHIDSLCTIIISIYIAPFKIGQKINFTSDIYNFVYFILYFK